ncbi:hypothetical protein WG906_12215 [Pedobacter sp. P351]
MAVIGVVADRRIRGNLFSFRVLSSCVAPKGRFTDPANTDGLISKKAI